MMLNMNIQWKGGKLPYSSGTKQEYHAIIAINNCARYGLTPGHSLVINSQKELCSITVDVFISGTVTNHLL